MSDPAKRRNIADSLARAATALTVAEAALAIGATADAVSRAYYASLQRQRELADYDSATLFDAADVRDHIDKVRTFGRDVTAWLTHEGLVDPPR